jgi:hypothetical protein
MTPHSFETTFKHAGVDRSTRTIHGVSVATIGEARGHDIFVDAVSLQQFKVCADSYKNGVKVKADHGSGVMATVGFLKNFAIDGDQLKADFEIFESETEAAKLFDMAEKIPDTFGLSVNFIGDDETIDGKTYARCSELFSADVVTEPAANRNGLFSAKLDGHDAHTKSVAALHSMIADATRRFALAASGNILRRFV